MDLVPDLKEWRFERFRETLARLPRDVTAEDILRPDLRISHDDVFELYYAPFDYVNEHARVVLMGITPGRYQLWKACSVARDALAEGLPDVEVLRRVKQAASFSGPMRANFVGMLDGIQLNKALGLETTNTLFDDAGAHLLFSTSAVSFPVFVRGRNYTGSTPRLLSHSLLRRAYERLSREPLTKRGTRHQS